MDKKFQQKLIFLHKMAFNICWYLIDYFKFYTKVYKSIGESFWLIQILDILR